MTLDFWAVVNVGSGIMAFPMISIRRPTFSIKTRQSQAARLVAGLHFRSL